MEQLLPGLRQQNLLAQPVKKTTTHGLLQRLDRVADGGLREMQLPRRRGETANARKANEGDQLPRVEDFVQP